MKTQNRSFLTLLFLTLVLALPSKSFAYDFPPGPFVESMTPGSLCEQPDSLRYDEQIKYCNRDVETDLKWAIIDSYDSHGFDIREHRADFKIDHLIPLCAGGSNETSNLWPQHMSIYSQTDKIEELTCKMMAAGLMLQKEAVVLILDTKLHLEKASGLESKLERNLDTHTPWSGSNIAPTHSDFEILSEQLFL